MKKIIAAFDGLEFSESTLHYTLLMARQTHAHIVGVFLDDLVYHSYGYRELVAQETNDIDRTIHQWNEKDLEKRNESVDLFEQACHQAGISFSVHRDRNVALQELVHESIYADLLIINWNETFTHLEEAPPTRFLRDLLSDVQCPVLLVPEVYHPIDKLTLLYDGEPTSVYAVKMFSYLLPDFKQLETEVVSIRQEDDTLHLPDNKLMKEFMKRHFPKAEYHIFKGDAEDRIVGLAAEKTKYAGGSGAYRRGRVSRWFKPSMADYLMKHAKMPLFVAHNK